MKILITPRSFVKAKDKALELFKNYDFEIIENTTGETFNEEEMIDICSDIDGIIVGVDPMTEKVLNSAKKLRAISKYGAGLDNIDLNIAKERGIKVERAVATNSTSVAELAVGLFFSIARSIESSARSVRNGGWGRTVGCELTAKTVGIIGLGSIGREVARMAHGLGMKIIGYDPYFNDEIYFKKMEIQKKGLDELYANSDFISLHLPLTNETKHMINSETLSMMKKTAYIINTSRGSLVDEDALYEALVNGVIAGAAQDVFSKEPPGKHKLLELDNFILTAHIGAQTKEAVERMAVQSTKNLIKMLTEGRE
jgi:D-3-phosphoglycerate dehydrogenase